MTTKPDDDDRIYPTPEEALRIVDENMDQLKPLFMKPLVSLLDEAFKAPTGLSYSALKVSGKRGFVVLCIADKSEFNSSIIAEYTEQIEDGINSLSEEATVGDILKDAMMQQTLTLIAIKEPHALIMAASDPASVNHLEERFELN